MLLFRMSLRNFETAVVNAYLEVARITGVLQSGLGRLNIETAGYV